MKKETTIKVNDRVLVTDALGQKFKGTVININEYREPSMIYCVYLDEWNEDYVFVSKKQIELLQEEQENKENE